MIPQWKNAESLRILESLVEQLGLSIRYEEMPTPGGFVKVQGKGSFILNRALAAPEKIEILRRELQKLDLQNVYLLPLARKLIYENE